MLRGVTVNTITTTRDDKLKEWTHDDHPLLLRSPAIKQCVEYIRQTLCAPLWWTSHATTTTARCESIRTSRNC